MDNRAFWRTGAVQAVDRPSAPSTKLPLPPPPPGATMSPMPNRRLALLLAVVAVAVAAWAAWSRSNDGVATRAVGRSPNSDGAAAPAVDEGRLEADAAELPSLTGRSVQNDEAPVMTGVEVLVLGRGDVPLPKVHVTTVSFGGSPKATGWTDSDGRVAFPGVPRDATLHVQVRAPATIRGSMYSPATVSGPDWTVRIASGIQIDGRVVDADTGRAIDDVTWALRFAYPSANRDWPPSGQVATCFHEKGDAPVRWSLRLRAPDGYDADDPKWLVPWVCRYAERLAFRYPLRKQALVRVEVRDASGARAKSPMVAVPGGRVRQQLDATGDFIVDGIPFYAGRRVGVFAVEAESRSSWPDPFAADSPMPVRAALAEAVLPRDRSETCLVRVELPAAPRSWKKIVAWGPSDVVPHVPILPTIQYDESAREGLVHVRVALKDGTPADDALVAIGQTTRRSNGKVEVLFPDFGSGHHELHLLEPGLVFTTVRFHHAHGRDTWVSLRESDGASLRVRAVDSTGGALPHARLDLVPTYPSGVAAGWRQPPVYWEDEARTVQRLDDFTDEKGARSFLHLDPVPTKIFAEWSDLRGGMTVELVAGRTTDVEIVLR